MSEYVTIGVIIKAKLQCSLIISLGKLFHNRIDVGKKLCLYASIAVPGCINLRSLPLVCLVLCVI